MLYGSITSVKWTLNGARDLNIIIFKEIGVSWRIEKWFRGFNLSSSLSACFRPLRNWKEFQTRSVQCLLSIFGGSCELKASLLPFSCVEEENNFYWNITVIAAIHMCVALAQNGAYTLRKVIARERAQQSASASRLISLRAHFLRNRHG